jgi:class 3 adenylate cyclase/pimeloyl-ACP methyl ester carboxylesterase
MERPDVRFARAADGAYLAYQVLGDGPTVLFWQEDSIALVDELWESPQELAWHEGLAAFARVIIYDRRGTGLSSRNVMPGSLEVQVEDSLAVLDAEGVERAVFGGFLESGATNVLLAATLPERVQALVWALPSPRSAPDEGYPWGVPDEYLNKEAALLERWGTLGWAQDYVALNAEVLGGAFSTESYIRFLARASRRTCTPDVAKELARIWLETDVRDVLPAVQAPMLMMSYPNERDLLAYIAERMQRTEPYLLPGDTMEFEDFAPMHDAIRRFVGAERAPVGLDSVLATVLFTDIVGSTELAAQVGDAKWKEVIAEHDERAKAELERFHGMYVDSTGDGLLARFDGPARAVRCARSIAEAVRPLGLEVRAGCHTGEVELDGDHVRGLAVHIGARVASMAGANEVWATSTVKDLTAGSGLTFEDAGEHELKGVPDRWHLYRVAG